MGPNETMRMIAADAAQSATATALAAVAVDNAKRDGMIGHVVTELQGLRADLKPIIESTTQHKVILGHHENQLEALWGKKDDASSAIRRVAAAAAKGVIRDEMLDSVKEGNTLWRGVMPAIVGSVISSIVVVLALYLMGFQAKASKDDTPAPTAQPHSIPVSTPPGP